MQTSILKNISVINSMNNCFNHFKLGSQEVILSYKSRNPKEVSSKDTSWNTCVITFYIYGYQDLVQDWVRLVMQIAIGQQTFCNS